MDYAETLRYLYDQLPVYQQVGSAAYKPGLDNSLQLDRYFSHPHTAYRTIHVAGTNGKGSTSHLLAAILQKAGYKVGLYTSPHLVDFAERIRVNGTCIDHSYVSHFVATHLPHTSNISPSFFEWTMMMAFCYFRDQQVDIAIIEVGLGGRLDSTNIISPILSVITNIGLDHTQLLGNTLPLIAAEKAGIIKPHTPVVIGEADDEAVKKVFITTAQHNTAPLYFAQDTYADNQYHRENNHLMITTSPYGVIEGALWGLCQERNAATVLTAIDRIKEQGIEITNDAVHRGFAQVTSLTGLQGRWQVISSCPMVVCDTAHNVDGIRYIVAQLATLKPRQLHIVFGMVNDKDISGILSLLPTQAHYYFAAASVPRSLAPEELQAQAHKYGLMGEIYPTVTEAYLTALARVKNEEVVFVGGSTFVVADLLTHIQQ